MKYFIRVSGPSSRGGGVYDGGNTLAEARRQGKYFLEHAPDADIAIVKSAPYHKTHNPHEERLILVESIQSPPIGGYVSYIHGRGRDPQTKTTYKRVFFEKGGAWSKSTWRPGYYYVVSTTTRPGIHLIDEDRMSRSGEKVYALAKSLRGGALWVLAKNTRPVRSRR